uniref:Uncharacterized protein n=2 Tax=Rhizobium rhizogenes TaxID=359 RepID=A0A7S4ZUW1_RHIRH|nr:hypothetical protein pC6.5c_506 [Rhizobium rhizogenes]
MGPVEARICLAARAATWVRELYRAKRVRGIRNAQISAARGVAESVAGMIGENLELIQEVTANSDNIAEGELVYVRDGSEDGTKGLTENGIDDLQYFFADIRTWDGGILQFLVDEQCDIEMIERVMADEVKRGLII